MSATNIIFQHNSTNADNMDYNITSKTDCKTVWRLTNTQKKKE